jgi:hypothetical protein
MKGKIPKTFEGGTSMVLDKHRRIVREMPVHIEKRMQNIAARNEILNATEAYNARLERDRVVAHLHRMPAGLQSLAARHHIGTLNQKIHHLANKGLNK